MAIRKRPQKIFRLNYWNGFADVAAQVSVLGDPPEVRMSTADNTFMSVRQTGITLSPGLGHSINIQGMSHNMVFGGLLSDLPFPMSIIPTTPFTPWPQQVFKPPLAAILPTVRLLAAVASLFPASPV